MCQSGVWQCKKPTRLYKRMCPRNWRSGCAADFRGPHGASGESWKQRVAGCGLRNSSFAQRVSSDELLGASPWGSFSWDCTSMPAARGLLPGARLMLGEVRKGEGKVSLDSGRGWAVSNQPSVQGVQEGLGQRS